MPQLTEALSSLSHFSAAMLRSYASQSLRVVAKTPKVNSSALFSNAIRRQYNQVDYTVYKGNQDKFNEVNELKSHRRFNRRKNLKWYLLSFILGISLSYNYSVHEVADKFFTSELPQSDAEKILYLKKLEEDLTKLPVVKSLLSDPNYKSFRSYELLDNVSSIPIEKQNTIHEALTAPGGIAISPLYFVNNETKEAVAVIHMGKRLSGYPFLVHGGMLGLVTDEILKESCASNYGVADPSTIHTVSLNMNYKFPTLVDNFIVIKSDFADLSGTEKIVNSKIETPSGRLLVKSDAVLRLKPNSTVVHGLEKDSSENKGWFWF